MRSTVLVALLSSLALGTLGAQDRVAVRPPDAVPGGPYTPGIRAGNVIYLSGQIGVAPGTRALVPGGIAAETRQALDNLQRVLLAAGSSLDRAVKCTVFLADINDFAAMNEVYRTYFSGDPPARSTIAAAGLVAGARVEIECIALTGA